MYEDFKQLVEDCQLVIPSSFEECFTYELQILYLKKLIDEIDVDGDCQKEIDEIKVKLSALEKEVVDIKEELKNVDVDSVKQKFAEIQKEIDGVKTSIQSLTTDVSNIKQNVATLTEDVSMNTSDIETLTSEMSDVKKSVSTKQDKLTFDSTPKLNSQNPVTSDGIKKALDNIDVGNVQEQLDAIKTEQTEQNQKISDNKTEIDSVKESLANQETDITNLQETVTNHTNDLNDVDSSIKELKTSVATKQNKLTFDSTPTLNSQNPVTSDGIKKAIDAGGSGGGGDSDYNVYTIESNLELNLNRKEMVVYEISSSGVTRHTDLEFSFIEVFASDVNKYTLHLPKDSHTFSHDVLYARVQIKGVGFDDIMVPVKTKSEGIVLSSDSGPIVLEIYNVLYICFMSYYNLTSLS